MKPHHPFEIKSHPWRSAAGGFVGSMIKTADTLKTKTKWRWVKCEKEKETNGCVAYEGVLKTRKYGGLYQKWLSVITTSAG